LRSRCKAIEERVFEVPVHKESGPPRLFRGCAEPNSCRFDPVPNVPCGSTHSRDEGIASIQIPRENPGHGEHKESIGAECELTGNTANKPISALWIALGELRPKTVIQFDWTAAG